jgi:serine/threonine-protein kinase HipA
MNKNGIWKFAPAYDLTFSNSSFGHHSTSVSGESKNPQRKHLKQIATHFGVKNATEIFDEVEHSVYQFDALANEIGMNKITIQLIKNAINQMLLH